VLAISPAFEPQCIALAAAAKAKTSKPVQWSRGALVTVLSQARNGDIEVKRNVAYILALLCESIAFHDDLIRDGGLDDIINLATLEDEECQEMMAFGLAHLSSNRDLQVQIVEAGALRPLVAMLSTNAEPRHYAGLALLKLADNFANHQRIAAEGGIQALLRLARARSTDEELQYKAALVVGSLASNAVKFLPQNGAAPGAAQPTEIPSSSDGASPAQGGEGGAFGTSSMPVGELSRKMAQSKTKEFLDRSLKKTR